MMITIPCSSLILRTAIFVLLWILLSGNTWHDWPLIVGTLLAAVATSCFLSPGRVGRPQLRAILHFSLFFIRESFAGGVDVAGRAFARRPLLDPAILEFPLQLESEEARVFFAGIVNLLPGTASVHLGARSLRVHVLDQSLPIRLKLHDLETRVSRLFDEAR
jgi:multicomponent Na+:H+ antiporter subunit E